MPLRGGAQPFGSGDVTTLTFDVSALAFAGVDPTGGTDSKAGINTALAALAGTGKQLFFPAGAYLVNAAITNTGLVTIILCQGATFSGAGAASVTAAAAGNTVLGNTPALYPSVAASQINAETITVWSMQGAHGDPYPFAQRLWTSTILNTWNSAHWGYNPQGVAGTQAYWTVEGNYESAPGVFTNEAHLEFYESGVTTGLYRPISAQYIHGSGTTTTTLGYADGATPGFLGIVEQSTSTQQVKWQDGQMLFTPAAYLLQFANGVTIVNDTNGPNTLVLQGNAAATMKLVFDPGNTQIYFQMPGVGTSKLFNATQEQTISGGFPYFQIGSSNGGFGSLWLGTVGSNNNFGNGNPIVLADAAGDITFNCGASQSMAFQQQLSTNYLRFSGANLAAFYVPVGGASATPFAVANNGAGIAVGAGGTFTPSAAQLANPRTALTGNITATSSVTIALPNAAGLYFFDVTGLTLGANTLSFTSGTQTITYSAAQMPHGGLIVVSSQGGNTLACCP